MELLHGALVGGHRQPAGGHAIAWDGRTGSGAPAAPGVYFYRLDTGDRHASRKLVRMR